MAEREEEREELYSSQATPSSSSSCGLKRITSCAAVGGCLWLLYHLSPGHTLLRGRAADAGRLERRPPRGADFCNEMVQPAQVVGPRIFGQEISPRWKEYCENMEPGPLSWTWPGRNWCWVRVKHHACYGQHTWLEAQVLAQAAGVPAPTLVEFQGLLGRRECDQDTLGAAMPRTEAQRQEALDWLTSNVAVYILNLPRSVDRWLLISARLQTLGIQAERILGVDLSQEGALATAQRDGLIPPEWKYSRAQEQLQDLLAASSAAASTRFQVDFGLGTVGCAAAHLHAMRLAAHRGTQPGGRPLALILEDDTWLEDDFAVKLKELLLHEAPCDWEVISLRSQCPYGQCISPHLARVQPDGNEPPDMCRHGVNYGFYAMLYKVDGLTRVADALAQEVWNASKPGCLANDVALASISDQIAYYAVPSSQAPGFLQHSPSSLSVRESINRETM